MTSVQSLSFIRLKIFSIYCTFRLFFSLKTLKLIVLHEDYDPNSKIHFYNIIQIINQFDFDIHNFDLIIIQLFYTSLFIHF